MKKLILIYISLHLFLLHGRSVEKPSTEQDSSEVACQRMTVAFADRLTPLLEKNDFSQFEQILNTYVANCGFTEVSGRIQIIGLLIEKESAEQAIQHYLESSFDDDLVRRYDDAAQKNYQEIFIKEPGSYNFLPLRHPIDELIHIKAEALLQSDAYDLSHIEHQILLLFTDRIDEFYSSFRPTQKPKDIEASDAIEYYKSKYSAVLYAGMIGPLGGANPIFKLNPTFGLTIMSPIDRVAFFELGMKMQINSGSRYFDYLLYNEIEHVKSDASFYFGGSIGFIAVDKGKTLLTPKVGIGFKSVSTGLSETSYYGYDDYYDDGSLSSGVKYNNVNTMDLSFSLAGMQHISKKKYIGLELAYHYIPYDWDKNLQTPIHSHYGSLELFFKF